MKEPKIIIRVIGGVVYNVYANIPALNVVVLDYDSHTDAFDNDQREAEKIISYTDEQREKGNTAVDFVEVY